MIIRALVIVLASSFLSSAVHAAQIRMLCPGALKGPIESLTAEFERASGHKVVVAFDIINSIAARIRAGEPFDFAMETPSQWEVLAAEGNLDSGVRANIASVKCARYVKKGAQSPNIDTAGALR